MEKGIMSESTNQFKRKQNSLRDNELKNNMCYQQAVIVALVNQYCSITIQKASKESIITETAPIISEVIIDGSYIEIRRVAEELSIKMNLFKDRRQLKEKTVKRRTAKSASAYVNNYLIDILREHNYFFNSKMSKKSNKTFQLERIQAIFVSNEFLMDNDMIVKKGKVINEYLNNLCKLENKVVLKKNDIMISKLLNE